MLLAGAGAGADRKEAADGRHSHVQLHVEVWSTGATPRLCGHVGMHVSLQL